MNSLEMWVKDGCLVARPTKPDGVVYSDKFLYDSFSMVKVETGADCTRIQWNMACANWASLLFTMNLVSACNAPFVLKYFNAGWFEESVQDAAMVADRIEGLLFKSDVRFSERAYTQPVEKMNAHTPEKLREVFASNSTHDDSAIFCAVDADREMTQVESVGSKSLLATIWGVSPNSYPCMTGHSYDRTVSQPYFRAVKTGKPIYDHVLAAMIRPDGEFHWMGYHRVILPIMGRPGDKPKVKVVSELAPVDISLL